MSTEAPGATLVALAAPGDPLRPQGALALAVVLARDVAGKE
jgi:hypothetical protein